MTTETKAPTTEDVERLHRSVAEDIVALGTRQELDDLRDMALLGVQVPGLRNDLATAQEQLQTTHRQVAEISGVLDPEVTPDAWGCHEAAQKRMRELSALQARVAELEGLLHVAGQHRDAAIDREDVLRAQVAELTRERDIYRENRDNVRIVRDRNADERDALRAQVEEQQATIAAAAKAMGAEIQQTITKIRVALSAPPAEAKTAEPEVNWTTRAPCTSCDIKPRAAGLSVCSDCANGLYGRHRTNE